MPGPAARYDETGRGYATTRRPDQRLAAAIDAALDDAASVVKLGAGAGSYGPADRRVVAVEPSRSMLAQRPPGGAPAAYLEPQVRAGVSTFARLGDGVLQAGLQRLAEDLGAGAWRRANDHLPRLETLDLGYRLVVHTNLEPRNTIA